MSDQPRLLPLVDSGCGCGPAHDHSQHRAPAAPEPAGGQTYPLVGLTCGHCVASVTEEVQDIDGVRSVDIDPLPGGESRITVTGDHELLLGRVAATVSEAGYELVGETTA